MNQGVMMQLNPYLLFNGQCEAAFKFYEEVFGGKIEGMMTHAGTPAEEHVPAEWRDKIMHARMTIGDSVLLASDAPPDRYQKPGGFSVSVQLREEPREGERIFNLLAAGGHIYMPFGETFWSPGFGMLADKFGIPWMINCERPH
jgi:PhnB protein